MSRFARVTEEVLLRHKELAIEHHKTGRLGRSAHETLYLYLVILLHSWESPYCRKTLPELCELYGLDPDNSYRRLKTLREKGWIAKSKKHIRPLLIHQSKTVIVTDEPDEKTVTVTAKSPNKTVTVTGKNCNSYSKSGEKTVTITVENDETSIPASGSGDAKTFLNLKGVMTSAAADKKTAAAAEKIKGKSQFSLAECLRYAEICKLRGEQIRSVEALATSAYKNGNLDAFISATLYPEKMPMQEIFDAVAIEKELADALEVLLDVRAMGEDITDFEKYYAPEIWTRLMEELGKC